MRRSIHPGDLFEAIYVHGYGAFAYIMREYPESAVQRAFEQARRKGWIECDGKLESGKADRASADKRRDQPSDTTRCQRGLTT